MKIMVTGAAGFIGSAVSRRLLERGDSVLGVDTLDAYYDVELKRARLVNLAPFGSFRNEQVDIADAGVFAELYAGFKPDRVVHLAAQAGVRHSLENPFRYIDTNVTGFLSVLEACRHHGTEHLVYASTSAVYGANTHMPFSTSDNVDHPLSIYAATKEANELMAHTYALGRTAKKNFLPLQPGDVPATFADVGPLIDAVGFKPSTPIEVGVQNFVDWYLRFYQC